VSPEVDLEEIGSRSRDLINSFAGEGEMKSEMQPIAFGLKALVIMFVMDEAKGSTEFLETQIGGIDGVNSVEVTDVRRAIG
jgi:elongation factor 1-beta